MLYIKRNPETNGAHENLCINARIDVPDGYAVVSADLEQKAIQLLPWVKLTVTDGVITAVEDDVVARKAWEQWQAEHPEPEPQLDDITALQLAVAEMAETQAADQTTNELALAELAEMIGG